MVEHIKLFAEVCISSLPAGSIYCLLGLSYVLIFKATKVLNLCQGEIMMIGAYVCYSAMELKLPFVAAVVASLALTGAVAFILERVIFRKVMEQPIFVSIMVAVGIGILLRGLVGILWGVEEKVMNVPYFNKMIAIPGFHMSYGKFSIILIAIVFIAILELFFKLSRRGMAMKATASNWSASMLMGVNIRHVFSSSWVLAALVSVFSGIFLAGSIMLEPTISLYGLVCLSVIVLGGVDSILGAIVAGYVIGLAEAISVFYIGGQSKHLAGFVVMFLVLMIRPTGFFGIKEVERV
jgi:branched-chain amino acid transport system permease protein